MANDKQLHRLQFDEFGDKFYVAKITGSVTMKHLAFVEGGDRIYKGEGTLTFSCLYPYLQEEVVVATERSVPVQPANVICKSQIAEIITVTIIPNNTESIDVKPRSLNKIIASIIPATTTAMVTIVITSLVLLPKIPSISILSTDVIVKLALEPV